ncbi:MAG: type I-E CRISPR-associated protein Cse2/CasB [Deltaproteobacteria bacterium]|nr:type I-E CRISPR-associated protein Cse2/CasB [Deltaproteobacteria bacterium]
MTTSEKTPEGEFIERIERLDTGELAMLRRGCGERDPVEGRCPWLVGLIHGVASEATSFLVASLLAQYKTADIKTGHHCIKGNFGLTWKRAIAGTDSKSIERRFHILLDADYDPWTGDGDLPYRLRQMVRYAANKAQTHGVDWPMLLTDLKFWNHPEKRVQKRWARSFFGNERPEDAIITSE